MTSHPHWTARLVSRAGRLIAIVLLVALGYGLRGAVSLPAPTQRAANVAKAWTCSMHTHVHRPYPGACPICGMDLVPTVDQLAPAPARPAGKKYACSMFCVPPLPEPGKCPACGMDMVEVDVEEDGDAPAEGTASLTLSAAARELAGVQVAAVQRRFVSVEIRMVGKVDYDETRLRSITAWVPGRLDRLYVDYTGVPVQQGDHLVHLYSPELHSAQTELLEAIRGAREMQASDVGSLRDTAGDWVQNIRDKFRLWGMTAEQIAEIERRGTPSEHMTIHAPISGIVIRKHAVEGMYVETGTRIYTIADLSRVWVKLNAYESDLAWLRYGQEVQFATEAYAGETFHGKIAFIDPVLDARTRTVKVRVNVENAAGRLKPEMFVRAVVRSEIAAGGRVLDAELAGKWISPMHPEVVKDHPGSCDVCGMPLVRAETLGFVSVEAGDAEAPLVIPAAAPLLTGKRAVVYVQDPERPGRFEGREITLGPRSVEHYIVKDGLVEGQLVVVNGAFRIDSAMQILARPSMMSPASDAQGSPGDAAAESLTATGPSLTPAMQARVGALFDAYFRIQHFLSRDQSEALPPAARQLSTSLADIEVATLPAAAQQTWSKELLGMRRTAEALQAAGDIEAARLQFALLSESMFVVAERLGTGNRPAHRFHCPMAFDDRGANWLQPGRDTENPYFGATMFRCGRRTQSFVPRPHDPPGDQDGSH